MAKVTMPQLGESVAEGTIGKWLKQPGDHVDKYEPLLEVITDKVNAEVPSPFEGVLKEILAEEGATVPNNAEIAVIETADDGSSDGSTRSEAPAEPAKADSAASESAAESPRDGCECRRRGAEARRRRPASAGDRAGGINPSRPMDPRRRRLPSRLPPRPPTDRPRPPPRRRHRRVATPKPA